MKIEFHAIDETAKCTTVPELAMMCVRECLTLQRDQSGRTDDFTVRLDSDRPDWFHKIICDVPGSMEEVYEALQHISDYEGDTDLDTICDSIEADVYTHDLLKWLAEDINRVAEVDEALQNLGGTETSILTAIAYAQTEYKASIVRALYEALEPIAEEAAEQVEAEEYNKAHPEE